MTKKGDQDLVYDWKWQQEKNAACAERHELTIERMRQMVTENTVDEMFREYFQECGIRNGAPKSGDWRLAGVKSGGDEGIQYQFISEYFAGCI